MLMNVNKSLVKVKKIVLKIMLLSVVSFQFRWISSVLVLITSNFFLGQLLENCCNDWM